MINEKRYPIKQVARRTGLSAHVIRAWEKRYQLVDPARTDTNRRLYSESDIQRLSLLGRLTGMGHAISSIADLDFEGLQRLLAQTSGQTARTEQIREAEVAGSAGEHLRSCIQAIIDFKPELFEERLHQAAFDLTQPILVESVIIPLIRQVGDLWHNGSIRIMHEHMATAILKPFLSGLRQAYRPNPNAPSIIVATPKGQIHEFGALIIALLAAAEGWRVTYLGADLPADEMVAASKQISPKVIALSIVYPANDSFLAPELLRLKNNIDPQIHVIAGGRISNNYQDILNRIGAVHIADINDFRPYLTAIEPL